MSSSAFVRRTVGMLVGCLIAGVGPAMSGKTWNGSVQVVGLAAAAGQTDRVPGRKLPAAGTMADRAFLDRYCLTCHDSRLKTAGLSLAEPSLEQIGDAANIWEKVIRKLRARTMPPAGLPRPTEPEYDAFMSSLEGELDRAAAVSPNPGRATMHRLNRTEYTNAIRDLLDLQIDSHALFPVDESSYGFDNIADVLAISPALLDRYISSARKISRLAVGNPSTRAVVDTYPVSPMLWQDDRMDDALPFGSRGGIAIRHAFPLDGEYVIRVRLQGTGGGVRGPGERADLDVRLDGVRLKRFAIGGPQAEEPGSAQGRKLDPDAEVRIAVKAGTRTVGIAFLKEAAAFEGLRPKRYPIGSFSHYTDKVGRSGVDNVQISGPYNATGVPDETPGRRRIFVCHPSSRQDERPCAEKILSQLARRAYRRPAVKSEVDTLLGFYEAGRAKGDFDLGIEQALRRLLVDPEFLFRVEHDPSGVTPGVAYRIGDLELASRLSFFLWSSLPDDGLLELAERGKLHEPAVLEQQVRRMFVDSRASALVTNFADQWLYVRNVQAVAPDANLFPAFDDNLREAFRKETELFLSSLLREDRSVVDMLTADYTFVNERLARHYGIPNVYGSHFRRVTFPDARRAGILGHGSMLTVTSYATRTSPVLRGKWLLENILGSPPPPPPPNVPDLPARGNDGKPRTVRERMEQHRRQPVCAGCHAQMDPLGFALENFDAIGRWRTVGETGEPLDTSGALPGGAKFDGPAELRTLLLERRPQVLIAVTEKLLTFALGRGLEPYDAPAVRAIVREAAASDYRWSAIILGVVKSTPFQMRRARE